MLNHATIKVMEAETQKTECGLEHQRKAMLFSEAEQKVQSLLSKLKKSINKSRPYFDEKEMCQRHLATQKERIEFLQKQVIAVKKSYSASLKKLEKISEEIHAKRGSICRGVREPGVGAENDAIMEMDLEKYKSQFKQVEANVNKKSDYSELVDPALEFIDNNSLRFYYSDSKKKNLSNPCNLDYELELDRCDLQSIGSMSATTSSAVSDEDGIMEDSEVDEFKQMVAMVPSKTKCVPRIGQNKDSEEGLEKPKNGKNDNFRLFSENWEKQMNGTINKLGTILSLKQKEPDISSESKEKY